MADDTVRPDIVRPGMFGQVVPADTRRSVFDGHNEQLIAQAAPIDAVFAGDSITEGWSLDAFFRGESGLLVNRGIGGDTTPFLRRRWTADVRQLRPQLVVLQIGINNTWELDEWVAPELRGTPDHIHQAIVDDIHGMVDEARRAGTGVALCSLLPTDIPSLASNAERNALVAAVNRDLENMAQRAGAVYVNYHSGMVQPDGLTLQPDLADDGLHPHVLGYRIMARALLDALGAAGITPIRAR